MTGLAAPGADSSFAVAAVPGAAGAPPPIGLMLAGFVALVILSALFAGLEIALVSANRARLEKLAAQGRRDARSALKLIADAPATIASLLVGNNLVSIAASSLMTGLSVALFAGNGVLIATIVVTPILLFFGEIVPKSLGRARPTGSLRLLAGTLHVARTLLAPAVAAVSATSRAFLALLRIPATERRPIFRRQELETLFLYGTPRREREGARDAEQSWFRMAGRALELGRRRTAEAMIPLRADRECPTEGTVGDALRRFRAGGMRYLAAVDPAGQVQGFVAAKALLGVDEATPIARFVRPAYVLDPDDPLDEAIQGFRRHQQSIALVRDREGRSLGLVTTEDLLEEVVGELPRMGRSGARPIRT